MIVQKTELNFVISSFGYGGQENVLIRLAQHYSTNYEVRIYCNDLTFKNRFCENDHIKIISYKNTFQLYLFLKNKSVMFFGFGHKIFTVILLKVFARNDNTKVFLRLSNNKYERKPNGILSFLSLFISNLTITIYDQIIVQNLDMKTLLIKDYELNENKVIVIPNPIPKNYFSKIPHQISNHLIFVGNLNDTKGLRDFLRLIIKFGKSVSSTIIGDGPLRAYLIDEISKLPDIKIDYIPFTNNIQNYLSKSTLFISPSYSEGSPNVIIEACAVGIPSVAYDCVTGPREIIIDKVNGFIVELGNEMHLFEATKKALYLQWNSTIIKRSVYHHRIDKIAEQYKSIMI